jgi:hypothetical protein
MPDFTDYARSVRPSLVAAAARDDYTQALALATEAPWWTDPESHPESEPSVG